MLITPPTPTVVKAIVAARVLSTKNNTLTPPTLPVIASSLQAPAVTATAPLNTLKDHFELYRMPPGEADSDIKSPPIESGKGNSKEYTQGETQEAGALSWLVDSIYNLAGSIWGEKFRPGGNIDLQPFFSEGHSSEMDALASQVEALSRIPRYKMIAHLLSTGGSFDFSEQSGKYNIVSLEGLSRKNAQQVFPMVFAGVTRLTQDLLQTKGSKGHGEASTWRPLLGRIAECWDSENSLSGLGQAIYGSGGKRELSSELEVVPTGWLGYPSGHAVGFVYALEEGEPVIYACNTGNFGDAHRTIVRYSIADDTLFEEFLRSGDQNDHLIQQFWKSGPKASGLQRCPEEAQIPLEIARVRQRRGNCPIAARKSCQLAMMWSLGVRAGLSPVQIKTVYKATTTLLRGIGVRAALNTEDPRFLGNAMMAMLSKWNRPDCRRDAYRISDALLKHHGEPESGLEYSQVSLEELNSETSLGFVKRALEVSKLDLNKTGKGNGRLIDDARRYHNHEVVALFHQLNTK